MQIRHAVAADAKAVLQLVRALAETQGTPTDLMDVDIVTQEMLSPQAAMTVLLAERDGEPLGYAALLPTFDTSFASKGFYVADLYVSDAARGSGVARALLAAAASLAQTLPGAGGRHLWLVRQPENRDGAAFYAKVADIEDPVVAHAITGDAFTALASQAAPIRSRHTERFEGRCA